MKVLSIELYEAYDLFEDFIFICSQLEILTIEGANEIFTLPVVTLSKLKKFKYGGLRSLVCVASLDSFLMCNYQLENIDLAFCTKKIFTIGQNMLNLR